VPPDAPDDRPWLTIAQAMQQAQVSRRTIYHWIARGLLQTVRTAGGRVRIRELSLFRPAPSDVHGA
jgi:excisionase family DNA binding protein